MIDGVQRTAVAQVEYRGYVFVNRALSSIQKGVQGNHATSEMFNDFILSGNPSEPAGKVLAEWTKNHKTLVYVDVGFHQETLDYYDIAKTFCDEFDLPHALFREDEWTMNCMATAFAIIVPNTIYDIDLAEYDALKKYFGDGLLDERILHPDDDPSDVNFCKFLKAFKLAI